MLRPGTRPTGSLSIAPRFTLEKLAIHLVDRHPLCLGERGRFRRISRMKNSEPTAFDGVHPEPLREVMLAGGNQVIADLLPDNKIEAERNLQTDG